jgi:hypothetical protein
MLLSAKWLGIVDKVPASQLRLEYIHTGWVVDNSKSSTDWSVEAGIYCYWLSGWQ